MDPKSINIFARKNLGFFLTVAANTEENKNEHAMYSKVIALAVQEIRDHKVRAGTVHESLEVIHEISEKLVDIIVEDATKFGYEDLSEADNAKVYAVMILTACIGQYNYLVERRKTEKTSGPKVSKDRSDGADSKKND